ncbi:PAS domain-containing protein [Steroidobacter sp. S1-65]|uniref:histidine kinase n=1 Tax=Steroidobacter gossypii TaxID=2805490 RepID=A0ABS1WVE0_9GAMM|nr:PAS domain-containing protein [Steroidobacter gossypii]MBM0104934.1 PAS domain-containing protein [Steroidobacter gossypii]
MNPDDPIYEQLAQQEHRRRRPAALLLEIARSEGASTQLLNRVLVGLAASEAGVWSYDLHLKRVWFSRQKRGGLGFAELDVSRVLRLWRHLLHPDDSLRLKEHFESYLKDPVGIFETEFRARGADESWRWIRARGRVIRDEAGLASRLAGAYFDVTKYRAVREQLARDRDLSDQIVNSLPGVFYIFDEQGRYLRWNDNLERVSGYTSQEIAALNPLQFFSGADVERVQARIAQVFEAGPAEIQADLVTKDGAAQPYYFTGRLIDYDGKRCVIGMGIDISERKRAEAALQASQKRYRALVNEIEGVVWEADPSSFQLTFVSDFAERLLGYPVQQWYQPGFWSDHIHPEDREQTLSHTMECIARGEVHDIEYRMCARDGQIVWVRDLVSVEVIEGKPHRLRGVLVDITERKKAEAARIEIEAQLRQAQKMEALGTLAGGIAHDFNNLLTTILGNAHIARQDAIEGSTVHESVDEILKAGRRAKDLVQRILAFSQPQAQSSEAVDLEVVAHEVVRLLHAVLPAGAEIVFSSAAPLPSVRADASQVHQVILNLATNAWHALEGRNGRIDVRLERLVLETACATHTVELPAGEYVRLSVHDTGCGIDPATLPRIFEPFFTTKPSGTGTGLGLSIVHGIVHRHGGAIRVDSEPGVGTTFHVYFPAIHQAAGATEVLAPVDEARGQGERILYIDDEEQLVFLTQRLLERRGYRVIGHTSAEQALSAFRDDPTAFDLIITDSNMPGVSGVDLARQVLDIRPDADVVLTSGCLRPEEIACAREVGVRDVILKPNTIEELAPMVRRLIDDQRMRRADAHPPRESSI